MSGDTASPARDLSVVTSSASPIRPGMSGDVPSPSPTRKSATMPPSTSRQPSEAEDDQAAAAGVSDAKPSTRSKRRSTGPSTARAVPASGSVPFPRHPRSTSPGAPGPFKAPHLPHSSDSLLHHLHTDPTSSHISLGTGISPVGAAMSGALQSVGDLLRPAVPAASSSSSSLAPQSGETDSPGEPGPSTHNGRRASTSSDEGEASAPPTGSRPMRSRVRSHPSVHRSRPKTAPSQDSTNSMLPAQEAPRRDKAPPGLSASQSGASSPGATHHIRLSSVASQPQLRSPRQSSYGMQRAQSANQVPIAQSQSNARFPPVASSDDGAAIEEEHGEEAAWPGLDQQTRSGATARQRGREEEVAEYPFGRPTVDSGTPEPDSALDEYDSPSISASRATEDDDLLQSALLASAQGLADAAKPAPSESIMSESPGLSAPAEGESCLAEFLAFDDAINAQRRSSKGSIGSSEGSKSSGRKRLIGAAGTLHAEADKSPVPAPGDELLGQPFATSKSDWAQFIRAYSSGNWDPTKTPVPPQALYTPAPAASRARSSLSTSSVGDQLARSMFSRMTVSGAVGDFGMANAARSVQATSSSGGRSNGAGTNSSAGSANSLSTNATSIASAPAAPPSVTRASNSDPIVPTVSKDAWQSTGRPQGANAEAAHLTVASAAFQPGNLAPFSVPSPDKELTDPFSSTTETPRRNVVKKTSTSSERGTSSSGAGRLKAGAYGSLDEFGEHPAWKAARGLPTIVASPLGTPADGPRVHAEGSADLLSTAAADPSRIPPASAPIEWANASSAAPTGPADYFGAAVATSQPASRPHTLPHQVSHSSHASSTATVTMKDLAVEGQTAGRGTVRDDASQSMPSKPRLEKHSSHGESSQASSLLHQDRAGLFSSHEAPARLGSLLDANLASAPLPENSYGEKGFLPAPLPPNEMARRKALYRYDILHTAPDVNFDRIAHLAKLVFRSKIVMIVLIDDDKQYHKVEGGLGASDAPRTGSICAHTILAKNDEPMVVLDTLKDWRFVRNPNVVDGPKIRFYAGAPLRTADGFNLGSLCLIDSEPRSEFPPRSRLALKEFAAIVIREMELWRDKSRLRARDRVQTSMERFTRECLELDNISDPAAHGTSKMDKVYERASQLMVKTLNVEGAFVLDLSAFESIQVADSEGKPTVIYQADAFDLESEAAIPTAADDDFEHAHGFDPNGGAKHSGFGTIPPWTMLGASEADDIGTTTARDRPIGPIEHAKFSTFLAKNPDGRIYESIVPSWIRPFLPPALKYALLVPVFNIDKQPFALICAYTCDKTKLFLEGYELQFLRAIGVVILSAVLKRRMVLADKAKSNFISNISHELRTPLHGILAAAELLSDTPLDSNQQAFLRTVQGCGNSLIETVNHVLDFTKLSGSTKGNMETAIRPGSVNLAQLIEETVEGCWIGQRARTFQGQSEIGSFYSPPAPLNIVDPSKRSAVDADLAHVETVVDIGMRERGWQVRCEKGGIRRVLMNLIGNSLKFTKDGYIQVTLRELPHEPGSKSIPIEMAVIDTGKGISRSFLKEQLFHPFSQENPLQTGTGLGLAIVNSIVRSESVNGKVDVWSAEGLGTEIKITLNVDLDEGTAKVDDDASTVSSSRGSVFGQGRTVSLHAFPDAHRGAKLNREVISSYCRWWNFDVLEDGSEQHLGEILVVNEDQEMLDRLLKRNELERPVLVLAANRMARSSASVKAFEKAGGFVQLVFKPVGPARLEASLRACQAFLERATPSQSSARNSRSDYFSPRVAPMHPGRSPSVSEASWASPRSVLRRTSGLSNASFDSDGLRPSASRQSSGMTEVFSPGVSELSGWSAGPGRREFAPAPMESLPGILLRRRSDDDRKAPVRAVRPEMAPRSTTDYPRTTPLMRNDLPIPQEMPSVSRRTSSISRTPLEEGGSSVPGSPTSSNISTVSIGDGGGVMLKMAAIPPESPRMTRKARVLIVDDNAVNSNLLSAYMRKKRVDFGTAFDGSKAVEAFDAQPAGYWDLILMDISMPVMDGFEATRNIRKIENDRRRLDAHATPHESTRQVIKARVKIMALTGLGSVDDRKRAFSVGVDGYLVKPVSFKSIDGILKNLGF